MTASDDNSGGGAERLRFDDDPGSRRSKWLAALLVVALVAWMGSGYLLPGSSGDEAAAPGRDAAPEAVSVAVRASRAESVTTVFVAEGEGVPERDTQVRAETSGSVAEVPVRKGADVRAGDVIARIAPAQREADLARAEEELARARRDYENAETLLERGVATVDRVAETRAALAAAEAQLASAREALRDTAIRAPFDGRLEALTVESGEFVQAGGAVARVVDLDPLTVTVRVPQQILAGVQTDQAAEVRFITGETRPGTVSFVAAAADAETRTFAAEIEVENADGAIPAGLSARVRVPTGEVEAHFLSPAILSLDPDGRLGVKVVEEDDRVAFHPVEIVRAETDGVWVSGLPAEARIITVGQGFVNAGEKVAPRPESEAAVSRAPEDVRPAMAGDDTE
ncbi:efflux RND transporter periplasmic adaptor subunit [Rhodosalinus sp. K401]|uniref:efflux RND transporter periplasmic adaptor subunit n=1 Tax=Rhodosalinus sp. K401 TaxID=3239195 RepID=UPI0035238712